MKKILSQKQCTKCKKWKDKSEFNKDKNRNDGLFPWCKICSRKNTNHHVENHREYYRTKARDWAHKHLEQSRAKTREWYNTHKEQAIAYAYIYTETRRARQLGNGGRFTSREWTELKAKYGNKCIVPGCERTDVTIDHIVHLSKGGKHSIENIQPLCKFHNSSKHTKIIDYR